MRDFAALLEEIEEWGTGPPYDFVGVCHLLISVLRNLEEFALEAELEDIGLYLETRDFDMLEKMLNYRRSFESD